MSDIDVDQINELAQHIRQVNGNNDMGAAKLAESILEWQARQAPASGEGRRVDWVDCPVCGEPDMQKTEHERGATLIHCCNHNCVSNGGTNSNGLTHPPAKVPEDVIAAARGYLLSDGPYDWSSVDRAHAVKTLANRGLLATAQSPAVRSSSCEHRVRHPHPCRECEDDEQLEWPPPRNTANSSR